MPIDKLSSNLYRIQELSVGSDANGYYLSMNPGKAQACVVCLSKYGPIGKDDLQLSEENLKHLFNGGKLDFDESGYLLQGITGHQLAMAQFRNFPVRPPMYVQAWSMIQNLNGVTLFVPENPRDQMTLIPVYFRGSVDGTNLTVTLEPADGAEGYEDGDLRYRIDDHIPIPIPKSWLGMPIPLRPTGESLSVVAAEHVAEKYIQKK